jgi:F0F1-type ATP synthase membrane subunit b/b'
MKRSVIAIKRSVILLTGAVLLVPVAAWCAEAGKEAAGGSWLSLLFYVINFALFIGAIWFLDWYLDHPISGFFANRARTINETTTRAEAALKEAQDLANRSAERMSRLGAEKKQLRADLDAETAYMANRIRELAREAALRIIRDAELTGEAITEAAQRRVRALLAQATGRRARELMVKSFTPEDQTRLLRGFEEKLAQEARR